MRDEDWWIETGPHLGWDGWCTIIFSFVVVGLVLCLLV